MRFVIPLSGLHIVAALALTSSLGVSCSQTVATTVPPEPPAQPNTPVQATHAPDSPVTTLTTIPWKEPLSVSILGVGAKGQRAVVMLRDRQPPYALALDTYDLKTGQRLERWQALDHHARALVEAYPRFRTLTGDFEADLARYAGLLRRAAGWSSQEDTPPYNVSVSPDGQHILYTVAPTDGSDGDWIHRASPEGALLGRFARMVRASYRLNFSPDSAHVAWMGGQPKFARKWAQVGYVLHVSGPQGSAPRTFPQVRGLLRTPLWTPDGKGLFALGRASAKQGTDQCLFHVDLTKPDADAVERVFCDTDTLNISYAPEHDRLLLLSPKALESPTQRMIVVDTLTRRKIAEHMVPPPRGLGRFAHVISKERVVLHDRDGRSLKIVDANTGQHLRTIEVAPNGSYDGRHTTKVVDGSMVLIRRDPTGASLVRVDL